MKLYLDNLVFSLQKIGGISVYWSSFLKKFNNLKDSGITLININGNEGNLLVNKILWRKDYINDFNLPIKLIRILPLLIRLPSKSIFHSSYLRVSLQKDIVNIVTIHDLAAEEKMISGIRRYLKLFLQSFAIRNADGIICVSKTTQTDLLKHYPFLNPIIVKTIYHGCSDAYFSIENRSTIKMKNILFVGGRNTYKNFSTCLQVIKFLKDYKLILVGGGALSEIEKKKIESLIADRYDYLGNLETEELNILYNNVHCLFYPTIYEGFGLPVLEAMKSGCPVVSSDIPAIREIANNAALLINPNAHLESFIQAIKSLEKEETREILIKKGYQRAANFNLDKQFNETIKFYDHIWHNRFS